MADRPTRYMPASQLPFSRDLIEGCFMKALREWPEGTRFETLKAFYLTIDDSMLSEHECAPLNLFHQFMREPPLGISVEEHARKFRELH